MKRIIEFFDRVYIINLRERPDRRKEAVREFSRIGIEVPNEKVKFLTVERPADAGIFHSVGVRGCYESHKLILQAAAREHLQNVLILEDDVWFRNIEPDFEQTLLARIRATEWDLMFLGRLLPPDDGFPSPLSRCNEDVRGTQFYAVNGRFLPELLNFMDACEARPRDHPDGGPMPIDGIYNHIRYGKPDISLFVTTPNLALQRSSRSDIAANKFFDQIDWLQGLVRVGRDVKNRVRLVLSSR
jgi:glycosyl transferase, family 25